MPKIANTFFEKELKRILPKFTIALKNKDKNDRTFNVREYLDNNLELNYAKNAFNKNIDIFHAHYQEKYLQTGKPEYNIELLNLDCDYGEDEHDKVFLEKTIQQFKSLFEPSSFKNGADVKGIVMFYENHATPALITKDNKILTFNLSKHDESNNLLLVELDTQCKTNKEIYTCENHDMSRDNESPQQADKGCVLFAFKYLKMLTENDYALFNELKPLPNNVYILPPDLLKYAQSETVVTKAMNNYKQTFGLSDAKEQDIRSVRDIKYGKFHILYHIIKHYTGDDEEKSAITEKLQTLRTELGGEQANTKKRPHT